MSVYKGESHAPPECSEIKYLSSVGIAVRPDVTFGIWFCPEKKPLFAKHGKKQNEAARDITVGGCSTVVLRLFL